MGPTDNDKPFMVYINTDSMEFDSQKELANWLLAVAAAINDTPFDLRNHSNEELSLLQELDYIDSSVQGDNHPAAIDLIMNAYNKYKPQS